MNLQASNYNNSDDSFDQLATPIKKWVWKQGWKSLRDIQSKAIPHLLSGGDAIISAATAGGKTEAAFLPLLSHVFNGKTSSGFDILYISPLKALINDQYNRLEELCEDLALRISIASSDSGVISKTPCGFLNAFCLILELTSPCHLVTGKSKSSQSSSKRLYWSLINAFNGLIYRISKPLDVFPLNT
jgi:CRISPR/Cas system-associated endonuclease/helicase Cas3